MRGRGLLQALFLNSPFLEFNEPWIIRKGLTPLVNVVGAVRPYAGMPQELGNTYGKSLHRDHHGEWDYDLTWKPLNGYKIHAGWVRAIRQAHKRVQDGLAIDVPILVATSLEDYRGEFAEAAHHADSVLNVEHIARYAPGLGTQVTLVQIEGGKHDLTLSRAQARERMFTVLDGWMTGTLAEPSAGEVNAAPTPDQGPSTLDSRPPRAGSRATWVRSTGPSGRRTGPAGSPATAGERLARRSGAQPHDAGVVRAAALRAVVGVLAAVSLRCRCSAAGTELSPDRG